MNMAELLRPNNFKDVLSTWKHTYVLVSKSYLYTNVWTWTWWSTFSRYRWLDPHNHETIIIPRHENQISWVRHSISGNRWQVRALVPWTGWREGSTVLRHVRVLPPPANFLGLSEKGMMRNLIFWSNGGNYQYLFHYPKNVSYLLASCSLYKTEFNTCYHCKISLISIVADLLEII